MRGRVFYMRMSGTLFYEKGPVIEVDFPIREREASCVKFSLF